MVYKKREILIAERLQKIVTLSSLKTQDLRISLINELERLFQYAKAIAYSEEAENRDAWVKVCAYIAQIINSLANSYDEVRFNEQMKELDELIERAKKRAGATQTGTPVA